MLPSRMVSAPRCRLGNSQICWTFRSCFALLLHWRNEEAGVTFAFAPTFPSRKSQGSLFIASRESHSKGVYQHARRPLCPVFALMGVHSQCETSHSRAMIQLAMINIVLRRIHLAWKTAVSNTLSEGGGEL